MKKLLLSLAVALTTMAASAASYSLTGGFNNWANSGTDFTDNGDGTYTVQVANLTTGFKVVATGSWSPQYGGYWDGSTLTPGVKFPLLCNQDNGGNDPNNIPYADGITAVLDATVVFDTNDWTLLVTGTIDRTLPALWLTGGFCSWNGPGEGASVALTESDGIYTGTATFSGESEFKICGSGWSPEFGFAGGEDTFTVDNLEGYLAGTSNAKLDLTGEYNVEFNYETKAIKFTDAAGVSTIAVDDNAAKVYYNLQGQLVENPTSGLYIVRQGNTVRKVIL